MGGSEAARLGWVDIAKGLCIVLVVTMHATLGTGAAMGGEGLLHPVVAFALPFRIPAFFLLSGLFLGRVIDRDWQTFADRRVVHFAYFYLLWLVIHSAARYGAVTDGGGVGAFLAHLARSLVEPYASLWFIYLLAAFSIAVRLLRRVPGPLLLAGAALLHLADPRCGSTLVDEFCARGVFFVAGYLFAARVLALADAARRQAGLTLACLAAWGAVEAWLALTPSGRADYPRLAEQPGLGLILGGAGALAVVAAAALLDRAGGPVAAALRTCGSRSIVIYLAFSLPMAAAREAIVREGLITDVGLACLTVTVAALVLPLALERAVRGTPLAALFVRPGAFRLDRRPAGNRPALRVA